MNETILKKIDSYSDLYLPLKQQAYKYINNNSNISKNKTLNIFHRPWVAPLNWGIKFFEKAKLNWFEIFQEKTNKKIPNFYKEFLMEINGCFIYDLSLYGLTPSIYTKGLLDRSQSQCHDIGSANSTWIHSYEIEQDCFYFGGRAYNFEENVGYFCNKENKIISILKNGKIVSEWNTFTDLLLEEIPLAEKMMLREIPQDVKIRIEN